MSAMDKLTMKFVEVCNRVCSDLLAEKINMGQARKELAKLVLHSDAQIQAAAMLHDFGEELVTRNEAKRT